MASSAASLARVRSFSSGSPPPPGEGISTSLRGKKGRRLVDQLFERCLIDVRAPFIPTLPSSPRSRCCEKRFGAAPERRRIERRTRLARRGRGKPGIEPKAETLVSLGSFEQERLKRFTR